jgi:hypothetical protein
MSNTKSGGLTQTTLKEYFRYEPTTGNFHRLKLPARSGKLKLEEVAGSINSSGYINIFIMNVCYKAHRLAFLYMLGEIPEYIDHVDGDRTNNKWDNLRPATKNQNGYNTKVRSDNTTGVKGLHKRGIYYQAQINIQGKHFSKLFRIDNYDSDDLAKKSAEDWLIRVREEHHKEFARHG